MTDVFCYYVCTTEFPARDSAYRNL